MLLHVHDYSHVVVVSGDLVLPSHITVLHVEQEVIGDDTKAIDSVLECDVKRTALLKEEAELSAKTQSTRYFSLVRQFVHDSWCFCCLPWLPWLPWHGRVIVCLTLEVVVLLTQSRHG